MKMSTTYHVLKKEMELKKIIGFKSKLESMSICALIKEGPKLIFCNDEDLSFPSTERIKNSDVFWMILEKKIRNTFITKGESCMDSIPYERTPVLLDVVNLQTPKIPPYSVLRTLLLMCHTLTHFETLVLMYPSAMHIELPNGDLALHRVIQQQGGGYKNKNLIENMIYRGIVENVGGTEGFGGLNVKNKVGRTPLSLIYGFVVIYATKDANNPRWRWFTALIQKAVFIHFHKSEYISKGYNHSDISTDEMEKVPLLHAALQIGSPIGLMNQMIHCCTPEDFCRCDYLGRTPLMISLNNKNSSAEIVMRVFHLTPVKVLNLLKIDKEGDNPLHRIIKNGIKYRGSKRKDEVALIGTIVEYSPMALEVEDDVLGMVPFMLASIDDVWSLSVIYGLLRTAPWTLERHL